MKQLFKKGIVFLLSVEAKLVLKKYHPKIVAVTGSVGKTSTKDAIFTVLSQNFFVRKSSKSFNSEIGVPLTILGLPNAWSSPVDWLKNLLDGVALILLPQKYPKWLVLEVGADRPGDIKTVASWLKPTIAVVTRLSDVPVHVEFFDSVEQVRNEKAELVRATNEKSTAILNADDIRVSSMRPLTKGSVLTFGVHASADVSGKEFGIVYTNSTPAFPMGVFFKIETAGKETIVEIDGALGRQQMSTSLAALAIAKALNLDMGKAAKALNTHRTPPGRMKILSGLNDSCIIDDTYNSSPVAANEAVETLRDIQTTGRKIAVLGDMLELGQYSNAEHEKLGKKVSTIVDELYTVGTRSKGIAAAARNAGFPKEKIFEFTDSTEAGEALKKHITTGDIVLVKGSQSARMEKTVAELLADKDSASKVLVRQEEEWKKR